MLLRRFAPFILSFLINSCAGPRTMILNNIGNVPLYDEHNFYYYTEIGDTEYYMQGVSTNGFSARIKAEVSVDMLYEFYSFSLEDLKIADEYGNVRFVIEPKEYERLVERISIRRFK